MGKAGAIGLWLLGGLLCAGVLWSLWQAGSKSDERQARSENRAEVSWQAESSNERKPWGVYQILWQVSQFSTELDSQIDLLGGQPNYVLFFRDLSERRGFPVRPVQVSLQRGAIPIISLELEEWGRRGPEADILERINAGEFDRFFRIFGEQAGQYVPEGQHVILRFGFEMNGDWFAWGQQPQAFVRAWRRAHGMVEPLAGSKVRWMWSPNILWGERTPEKDLFPYHPGETYVDHIALDGYNFGDNHSQWHRWQSFSEIFERSIEVLYQRYGQPVFLAEVGCADDPRKAAWLTDFFEQTMNDDRIAGWAYFNYDKRSEGEPNWRLDSDMESLAVARVFLSGRRAEAAVLNE
ncbi:MAG: glycoside hydrolase family 26 protein [Opitutales bacterium]